MYVQYMYHMIVAIKLTQLNANPQELESLRKSKRCKNFLSIWLNSELFYL